MYKKFWLDTSQIKSLIILYPVLSQVRNPVFFTFLPMKVTSQTAFWMTYMLILCNHAVTHEHAIHMLSRFRNRKTKSA